MVRFRQSHHLHERPGCPDAGPIVGLGATSAAHDGRRAVLDRTASEKMSSAYPTRSLLRCGLEVCSTSQSIHTKALPRPTTTPKNSNVRPGAVSMVNIPDAMQAAYQ